MKKKAGSKKTVNSLSRRGSCPISLSILEVEYFNRVCDKAKFSSRTQMIRSLVEKLGDELGIKK